MCGSVIGQSPCSLISFCVHIDAGHRGQLLDCPEEVNLHS